MNILFTLTTILMYIENFLFKLVWRAWIRNSIFFHCFVHYIRSCIFIRKLSFLATFSIKSLAFDIAGLYCVKDERWRLKTRKISYLEIALGLHFSGFGVANETQYDFLFLIPIFNPLWVCLLNFGHSKFLNHNVWGESKTKFV